MLLLCWFACSNPTVSDGVIPPATGGPLGLGRANPFPNAGLFIDGHLDLRAEDFSTSFTTPLSTERLNRRQGFSVAQPSVLELPGIVAVDLPTPESFVAGEGGVTCWDLTDSVPWPCMAELDAHDQAVEPVLIVRPLQAFRDGHQVAIAVRVDVVPRPLGFDELLTSSSELGRHHSELLEQLSTLGAQEVSVAWDFIVAKATTDLTVALELATSPAELSVDSIRTDGEVVGRTFKAVEGTLLVDNFLKDDLSLVFDEDGALQPQGTVQADLYVHIPDSVKDAPAGTVPVLIIGHGILSNPKNYLDDPDDPSSMVKLADELGAVVVATTWRGLTLTDLEEAVYVAQDFGRFPQLTDRMVQGQVNTRAMVQAIEDGLLDDPAFYGEQGQVLSDGSEVLYYGISLGGIMGAVFMAQDPPVQAAALHVGGAMWGTMLERSSNWTSFAILLESVIKEPADRQFLYALSQMYWDPVDPISYAEELQQRPILFQVSIGDEQVSNLTSEALARSVGWPLATPEVNRVVGLNTTSLPTDQSVFVQFNPMIDPPAMENTPASKSGAHDHPRNWRGTLEQIKHFLRAETRGEVQHFCGAAPCSESNQGEL